MMKDSIPAWALDVLQCPATAVRGVIRTTVVEDDPSIAFYRSAGGAHFHERSQVGYAMTTLDTSVYHGYLADLRPENPDAIIVDVGGGDGRNAMPWLEWGYRRVIIVDPAGAALERLRERLAERSPEWLERVALIEADARTLPLRSRIAERVLAIEALAYLNEDYRRGLTECARVVMDGGRLLIADRDYEGSLLARLFYVDGVDGLLAQAGGRDAIDRSGDTRVRSRCFTANELAAEARAVGLDVLASYGVSAMSLVLGYLRNTGKLAVADEQRLPDVRRLLDKLGREGMMRRSHVIVAERRLA